MIIEQTVEVPVSRQLIIEVPREIPAGRTILTFTPAPIQKTAAEKHNSDSISKYFGIHSPLIYGDGVVYQRNLRDEWDG
jgi:hypothetical protein